jgi:hypothetical protein
MVFKVFHVVRSDPDIHEVSEGIPSGDAFGKRLADKCLRASIRIEAELYDFLLVGSIPTRSVPLERDGFAGTPSQLMG